MDVQSAARRWAETWERAWPAKHLAEIGALYDEALKPVPRGRRRGRCLGTLTALRLADRWGFGRAFAASLLSCFVPLSVTSLPL